MKQMSTPSLSFHIVNLPVTAAICLLYAGSAGAQVVIVEPPLPQAPVVEEQGYFPTLAESALLRGPNDARSIGGGLLPVEEGPDLSAQIATDIFPYEDAQPNFYQRHPGIFRPLDQSLGWLTPRDALTFEAESYDNTSLTVDARLGVLTRQFSPELAMIKAGPLYFDLLWVGAGITWSDFAGNRDFDKIIGDRNGDGATAFIDLGIRGLIRFTDTLYLSVVGNLMYLPYENEFALRFGSGRDAGLTTRLNFSETIGAWDILLYSEFLGRPGLNWYGQGTMDEIDRSGRYFYGFQTVDSANEFYNDGFAFFSNRVGLNANRLVLDNQWRLNIAVDHTDYWKTFNFENHTRREHAGISFGYEGSVIPFAPRLSYDIYSQDGFDSLWHRAYLDLTGRLTENIHWISRTGYSFTTGTRQGQDQFLWQIGLDHTITKNTMHWLRFGEGIFDNELTAESITSRFVSWGIDQRLDRRLFFRAFVQFGDSETIIPSLVTRERFGAGMTLRYQPLDFTQVVLTVLYENIDQAAPVTDRDRWLYRAELNQQLGHRLTGHLFYQHEDNAGEPGSFKEHVLGMSIRRYF